MIQEPRMNMVIICMDDVHLKSIEYLLAEAMVDKADISDIECLTQYNAQPKDIDILLIEEKLYQQVISKQNCKNAYMLIEDEKNADLQEKIGNKNVIYKYSSIRSIIDKIDSRLLQNKKNIPNMNTKLISVYSPAGGCGKTTISIALASQLAQKGYKVLYISTEVLQDYQDIIGEDDNMPEQIAYRCKTHPQVAVEEMLRHIKKKDFEYFPTWKRLLPTYGMTSECLMEIATCIQKKNIYDYVVTELSCEIREQKLNFLYQSDRVVIVMRQDKRTVDKLQKLLDNVVEWRGQGVIVCNFYDETKPDYLRNKKLNIRYAVCERIRMLPDEQKLSDIISLHLLDNTTLAVM